MLEKLPPLLRAVLMSMVVVLAACGGGAGDSADGTNSPNSGGGDNGGGENEDPGITIPTVTNVTLKSLDIAGAEGLIITDSDGTSNRSARSEFDSEFEANTLYKVMADGSFEEVEMLDTEGNSARGSLKPTDIVEMGNGWVLMYFDTSYQYVTRYRSGDTYYDDGRIEENFDYEVRSRFLNVAYLVDKSNGVAYRAPWRGDAMYISDKNGDGIYDQNWDDQESSDFWATSSFEISAFGSPQVDFDAAGDMYVIGAVYELVEFESEGYYYHQYEAQERVLKVNTSDSGADVLTATVVNKIDLDAEVYNVRVSSDARLLSYEYRGDDEGGVRILDLVNDSAITLNALSSGRATTSPQKASDGKLYVLSSEEIEILTPYNDELRSYSAIATARIDTNSSGEVTYTPRAIVNEGVRAEFDVGIEYTIPSLDDFRRVPSLVDNAPEFESRSERLSWFESNIEPIVDPILWYFTAPRGINIHWSLPSSSHVEYNVNGQQIYVNARDDDGKLQVRNFYKMDWVDARFESYTESVGFESFHDMAYNASSLFFFGQSEEGDRIVQWTPQPPYAILDANGDRYVHWPLIENEPVQKSLDLDLSTFDVKRFKVLSRSRVLFEADILRSNSSYGVSVSLGDRVLAEADFGGNISIIDVIDADSPQVLVMERVNQGDFLVVDGSPEDWSLDYQFALDQEGDTTNYEYGDLAGFSQTSNEEYHWILAELYSELGDARLIVNLSNDTYLEIGNGVGSFVEGDENNGFFDNGSIFANGGTAVEIRLSNDVASAYDLDGGTYPNFRTELDMSFGSASVVSDSIENATLSIIDIELLDPVGPSTVSSSLFNGYELQISDPNWNELDAAASDNDFEVRVVNPEESSSSTLEELGGSYRMNNGEVEKISITLPLSAIGVLLYKEVSITSDSISSETGNLTIDLNLSSTIEGLDVAAIELPDGTLLAKVSYDESNGVRVTTINDSDDEISWSSIGGSFSYDSVALTLQLVAPASEFGFDPEIDNYSGTIVVSAEDLSAIEGSQLDVEITSESQVVAVPVDEQDQ